jgi:beta-lactamase superfamily II metal-dependent hydrolase
MYDVGFGDAFLITFPTSQGEKKILIDCGTFGNKGGPRLADVVRAIIDDVTEDGGRKRIDVVIATHRHRDHVSGFNNPLWREVEVKEVWMPWTEHPTDPAARDIREAQSRLALQARQQLTALQAQEPGAGLWQALGEVAENALSNAAAMNTLHHGFRRPPRPRRRFLPTRSRARTLETDALPGVLVHVLGPARDKDIIRDVNPPEGASYLSLSEGEGPAAPGPEPFAAACSIGEKEFSRRYKSLALTWDVRDRMKQLGKDLAQALTVSLDAAVNGTSLMLLFQIGRAHLLFPGDAQWGTWQAVLGDPAWRELLRKTTFYKVGHHGSHNATPPEFVAELLPKGCIAMVPVRPVPQWEAIPKKELLAALGKRSRKVIRSDQLAAKVNKAFRVGENALYVDVNIPL